MTHIQNLMEEPDFSLDQILNPAVDWNLNQANTLFGIARRCLVVTKRNRPDMSEILGLLGNTPA